MRAFGAPVTRFFGRSTIQTAGCGRAVRGLTLRSLQIESGVDMAPGLRELLVLAALAGFGCGLAVLLGRHGAMNPAGRLR
jgi:hypothetical protein